MVGKLMIGKDDSVAVFKKRIKNIYKIEVGRKIGVIV